MNIHHARLLAAELLALTCDAAEFFMIMLTTAPPVPAASGGPSRCHAVLAVGSGWPGGHHDSDDTDHGHVTQEGPAIPLPLAGLGARCPGPRPGPLSAPAPATWRSTNWPVPSPGGALSAASGPSAQARGQWALDGMRAPGRRRRHASPWLAPPPGGGGLVRLGGFNLGRAGQCPAMASTREPPVRLRPACAIGGARAPSRD
jgi:hypothetical protein